MENDTNTVGITPSPAHPTAANAELMELERQRLMPVLTDTAPPWFGPAFGVAVAVFVASYDIANVFVQVAAILLYSATVGLLVGLKIRRNGVQPRLQSAPRPIVREILFGVFVLMGIGLAVIGAAALTTFRFRFTVAGLILGTITWIWFTVFTARYERLARQIALDADIELP